MISSTTKNNLLGSGITSRLNVSSLSRKRLVERSDERSSRCRMTIVAPTYKNGSCSTSMGTEDLTRNIPATHYAAAATASIDSTATLYDTAASNAHTPGANFIAQGRSYNQSVPVVNDVHSPPNTPPSLHNNHVSSPTLIGHPYQSLNPNNTIRKSIPPTVPTVAFAGQTVTPVCAGGQTRAEPPLYNHGSTSIQQAEIQRGLSIDFRSIHDIGIAVSWASFFRDQFYKIQSEHQMVQSRNLQEIPKFISNAKKVINIDNSGLIKVFKRYPLFPPNCIEFDAYGNNLPPYPSQFATSCLNLLFAKVRVENNINRISNNDLNTGDTGGYVLDNSMWHERLWKYHGLGVLVGNAHRTWQAVYSSNIRRITDLVLEAEDDDDDDHNFARKLYSITRNIEAENKTESSHSSKYDHYHESSYHALMHVASIIYNEDARDNYISTSGSSSNRQCGCVANSTSSHTNKSLDDVVSIYANNDISNISHDPLILSNAAKSRLYGKTKLDDLFLPEDEVFILLVIRKHLRHKFQSVGFFNSNGGDDHSDCQIPKWKLSDENKGNNSETLASSTACNNKQNHLEVSLEFCFQQDDLTFYFMLLNKKRVSIANKKDLFKFNLVSERQLLKK